MFEEPALSSFRYCRRGQRVAHPDPGWDVTLCSPARDDLRWEALVRFIASLASAMHLGH